MAKVTILVYRNLCYHKKKANCNCGDDAVMKTSKLSFLAKITVWTIFLEPRVMLKGLWYFISHF